MHPRDYQPGERVPGTVYRVVRLIGAGGMGTVYEVEDTTIGKKYVLKTLHPQLGSREDLARRMQDEARTLARLNHPNIVEVITAGITADDLRLPYYVMERLNGQSLRSILTKKGRLDLPYVYHIAIDLLDALDHAHDKGVIHRDVKPDNIFLHRTASGVTVTKLLDFGIVSLLDGGRNETAGRFLGTLRYAAPEQLRGDKPSPRTDVYAAALVIYEMIAGRGPFDGEGDSQKIGSAHLHKAPPSVTKHVVAVPKELDALLMAALSKSPDARPRDAFSFAASLRNIERLEASPTRSTPPASLSPSSSRPPPRPPPGPEPSRSVSPAPPFPPRPSPRSASITVPLSLVPTRHASPPAPMTPPKMPIAARAPLGVMPATGVSPLATAAPVVTAAPLATAPPVVTPPSLVPSTPPTSFPRTTLRGMSPPTLAPTLAPPFGTATATAVDAVDRGAPTRSMILEGPRLFRPRADPMSAVSSVPTYVPTTSPPVRDTVLDDELTPPESGVGRSVAPHVRSLAAAPLSRLPWGAIAASVVGVAGLVVLAVVAFSLRHTASGISTPSPNGLAAEPPRDRLPEPSPVITLPAPTLQPDSLEGAGGPLLRLAPPSVEAHPADTASPSPPDATPAPVKPPPKAGGAEPKPRPHSVSAPPSGATSAAPSRLGPGVAPNHEPRERPGPGF
jgi:serine/threonine-protein kinase